MLKQLPQRLARVTARLTVASFLLTVALPALAQAENENSQAPESGTWKALAMAIVFGIAIGIGCFMSPKRSHQD